MSDSPPSSREILSGRTGLVVGLLTLFVLAYSFLVVGNVLFVLYLVLPALSLWLFYRFVRAQERIASAQERRAAASERRARAAGTRAGIDPASGPSSAGRDADDTPG